MNIYRISDYRLRDLLAKIDKVNHRADKLGLPGIAVTVEKIETVIDPESGAARRFHFISLFGEPPQIAGWQFQAKIDHGLEGGDLILAVPGQHVPDEFRHSGPVCDHCGFSRTRRTTYVLFSGPNEYKQVGSTCLADFLGHTDPREFAALAEAMANIEREAAAFDVEETERGYGGRPNLFSLERYLSFAAALIRRDGFISRKRADEEQRTSTATIALDEMFPLLSRERMIDPGDDDLALARAAIAWAQALEPNGDDYLYNLSVVANSPAIEWKHAGLAASTIAAYQREVGRRVEQDSQIASQHVGAVGQRGTFTLAVIAAIPVNGFRGRTAILHKLIDQAGNAFVWIASSGEPLEIGKVYTVTATVKEHGEYRGVKQTKITRAKIVAEADFVPPEELENAK